MTIRLSIINGPNLNLLGEREPDIYGSTTLASIEHSCQAFAKELGATLEFSQSNSEGTLVDWIQQARLTADALIINPAGYTFHSIPILDALQIFSGPVIELHLSNIHARDAAHQHSILSAGVTSVICGLGAYGYIVAMQSAARMLGELGSGFPEPARVGPL